MSKTASLIIGLAAVAMGLGVPGVCLYASLFYGFNYVAASIVAIIAVLTGGGVAVVGVILGPLGQTSDRSSKEEREKLRALRDLQRTTLEELDEVNDVLAEIRDILRAVEE
jgi:hypothetical protein